MREAWARRGRRCEGGEGRIVRLTGLRDAMVAQKKDYWISQADIQAGAISAWIARAEAATMTRSRGCAKRPTSKTRPKNTS